MPACPWEVEGMSRRLMLVLEIGWLDLMRLEACMKLRHDHHLGLLGWPWAFSWASPFQNWQKQTTPNVTGWQGRRVVAREDYSELIPPWHSCWEGMLWFLLLVLDSKAGMGLAISINSKAEHTTTYNIAGVAPDSNSRDRRLDGLRLVSWPLFEWCYANSGGIRIDGSNRTAIYIKYHQNIAPIAWKSMSSLMTL